MNNTMNDQDLLRYSRQIMLPQVDVAGQERILDSSILIVGLGGLGCPAAIYLASAGVGHLVLADHDQVDLSNLQRQVLHTEERIGMFKVESARQAIQDLNPNTKVTCITEKLAGEKLAEQVANVDVVVDCSDNFTTRYALNEACVRYKKPLVSGAAIRFEAQLSVFDPRDSGSPCYRCLYQADNDEQLSCSESGVMSPLVGMVGSMQALEALKLVGQFGEPIVGKLMILDGLTFQWQILKLDRRKGCSVCDR